MMVNAVYEELERIAPGSVRINSKTGVVTLIGWEVEHIDLSKQPENTPRDQNKTILKIKRGNNESSRSYTD